jgi:hypothetical protein
MLGGIAVVAADVAVVMLVGAGVGYVAHDQIMKRSKLRD